MSKSLIIIFQTLCFFFNVQLTCDHLNWRLPRTTCLTCSTLLIESLPLIAPSFLSPENKGFNPYATQKHVFPTRCYLITLAKAFQVLVTEFPLTGPKISCFMCCPMFIVCFSVFIAEQPEKKRRCKQQHLKNKIQWLQKAMIIVVYSQDIMLDDNIIRLFLFRL